MGLGRLTRPAVVRAALWLAAAVAIAAQVATVRYVPTPSADGQFYGSIALARATYGVGVPSITWNSPVAVDHIPFYGPVFFDLAALSIRLFGVGILSFRLVSLAGTVLLVLGTVMLAREFSGSPRGPLLAAVLVLLSPEVNEGAGTGAMHMLAVGFEVLALAFFASSFSGRWSGVWRAGLAGGLMGLAAFTTPRSYQFVFAFCCAALLPSVLGYRDRAIRLRFASALLVLGATFLMWTTLSHDSPAAWVQYMAYIFTHEDTDVAILATTERDYSFHWSAIITLAAVLAGSFVAARSIDKPTPASDPGWLDGRRAALSFLLLCTWIQLVTTTVTLNYTFLMGEYILLPAFAVLVAWPRERIVVPRRIVAASVALLLAADCLVLARRYAYAALTWESLGPDRVNAFFREHVPAGSTVVGPEAPFFFPVEKAGSRYRTIEPRSWADWARWVPIVEPEALLVVRRFPVEPTGRRFLIWVDDGPLPEGYECADPHLAARYEAPRVSPDAPRLVRRARKVIPGYPSANLYRLPEGCPAGYDPTAARSAGR